jgi:ubiquinone/menaquinone biosynthesis C-methylase UbiE
MLDPVAAYDRIAPSFARLSEQRRAYLDAVERLIVSAIPAGSHSLLDIGAGDGVRSLGIAQAAGLKEIVLLDPSASMREHWPAGVTAWAMRAEDLHAQQGQFDVITCLWNVLSHIFPARARSEVLRQCARLLGRGGRIFVDVNHRYNASITEWRPRPCKIITLTRLSDLCRVGQLLFELRGEVGEGGLARIDIQRLAGKHHGDIRNAQEA